MPETATDATLTPHVKTILSSPEDAKGLGPKAVIHWVTTDAVDRSGEVVVATGGDWTHFARGVTFAHSERNDVATEFSLPVAVNKWWKVADHPSGGKGILARTEFLDDSFANRVCSMYKGNPATETPPALNSYSLTFVPKKGKFGPPTAEEIRKNPGWARAKTIYREWSPLVYSCVLLPDNPNCVTISKSIMGLNRPQGKVMPDSEAPVEPVTREAFVASHPEAAAMIDGLTAGTLDAVTSAPSLVSKGVLLGDLRKPALAAVIERYNGRLNTYLWGLVYSDPSTGDDLTAKVKAACDEARDAVVTLFEATESLRSPADAVNMLSPSIDMLSRGMTVESKSIFGDPAEGWKELAGEVTPDTEPLPVSKATPGVAGAGFAEAEEDSEDVEPEPLVRVGSHVRATDGEHKGMVGKVKSVHRSGMVPDVEENVRCSKSDPGARVECYKAFGGGHVETGEHVGVKVSHLEKTDELKAPPKKKAAVVKAVAPVEKGWNAAEKAAYKSAKLAGPDFFARLERRIAERFEVTVLGKV